MRGTPITVLVVDDSKVARELLAHIINADRDLSVVAFANSGEEALEWLKHNKVDVITMDVVMPGINGLQVTRQIMETTPIPIVIISAAYTASNEDQVFEAIEAGALAVLDKPTITRDNVFRARSHEIANTIKTVAEVKLVRRRIKKAAIEASHRSVQDLHLNAHEPYQAVAIGASLGGPLALASIIQELPESFPVPIFVVQHIAAGFTSGFAKWLQGFTKLRVTLGTDGELASPGCIYIAPSNFHMEVHHGGIIALVHSDTDLLQPSVGKLFKSIASTYGARAIGIMLTGMGRDGVEELLTMKKKGAYTIAQSKEGCVMYGMPQEAVNIGAVRQIVSLELIASTLTTLLYVEMTVEKFGGNL